MKDIRKQMKVAFLLLCTTLVLMGCTEPAEPGYIDVLGSQPELQLDTKNNSTDFQLKPNETRTFTVKFNQAGAHLIWLAAATDSDKPGTLSIELKGSDIATGTEMGPFDKKIKWTNRRKFDTRGLIYVDNPGKSQIVVENGESPMTLRHLVLTPSSFDYADESGFKKIEFDQGDSNKKYDVIVYGATPGGITAAMQASRNGNSVLLLEKTGHLGGHMINGVCNDEGKHVLKGVRGGIGEEFFERIQHAHKHNRFVGHDGYHQTWEPHAADRLFAIMLLEEDIPVRFNQQITDLQKEGASIVSITMNDNAMIKGKVFIDASYEGDLMVRSGVSWTYGRESATKYNESLAGISFEESELNVSSVLDENGELLYPLQGWKHEFEEGDSSHIVQTHSVEVIATSVPENMKPFPKPENYDPDRYELYLRHAIAFPENYKDNSPRDYFSRRDLVWLGKVPNGKWIMNDRQRGTPPCGLSTGSKALYFDYPIADYEEQKEIYNDEVNHFLGLMYFLQNDPRLPDTVRNDMRKIGLSYDEFVDNDNLPYAMYVRENKRIIGSHVFTQHDVEETITKKDAIALGSHKMDSHTVRHLAKDSTTYIDEGRYFTDQLKSPYQISLRTVTPKKSECNNLLVSYCLSASHVAHSSLRTIVCNLSLGQSTGVIASLAANNNKAVQDLDIENLQDEIRKTGVVIDIPTE